jgi:hypothetical protein
MPPPSRSLLLRPTRLTRRVTPRTVKPARLNHDPAQTPRAPPPLLLHAVGALDPVRVHRQAALGDVLLVVVAQVVAEVVAPVKGRVPPRALGVVAVVGLLALVGPVLVLVVPVQVRVALERDGLAAWDEAAISV